MIRITWNNLTPPGFSQEDVIRFLLTPAVFENPQLGESIRKSAFYCKNGKTLIDTLGGKTARTRLFSWQKESGSLGRRMLELLLLNTKSDGVPYDFHTFPIRLEFRRLWQKILTPAEGLSPAEQKTLSRDKNGSFLAPDGKRLLTAEEVLGYRKYVSLLLDDGSPEALDDFALEFKKASPGKGVARDFQEVSVKFHYHGQEFRLEKLLNAPDFCPHGTITEEVSVSEDAAFLELLATLSVIACCWYIWEEAPMEIAWQEQLMRLCAMIFPAGEIKKFTGNTLSQAPAEESSFLIGNSDSLAAEKALEKAAAYMGEGRFSDAGALCEKIFLEYKNASDHLMGTCLAHLLTCCENGYPKPDYFASADDIRKEARNYNCIYLSDKRPSIKADFVRADSADEGFFTLNDGGLRAECVKKTAPAGWACRFSDTPAETLLPGKRQRMILIRDDYEANLQDALDILDRIRRSISEKESVLSDWENLEIDIRCREESVTSLLDTALSYFTEDAQLETGAGLPMIRINLIDEAKRSADSLFARHPHFYPLTFARNKDAENKTVHLVVVTDNPDLQYAKWLIKEGFWTLPRYDTGIRTKITVLSPDAKELCQQIAAECPGLTSFVSLDGMSVPKPYPIDIDDICFPELSFLSTSFTGRGLQAELDRLCSTHDFLYFAVDADSDLESIRLGVQIRETLIRKAVFAGKVNTFSRRNSIIALRCFHPDYAGMIQDLIIPKEEEHACQWFNDYNLLSFGSAAELYSWNELDGGILEEISRQIHLQYDTSSRGAGGSEQALASYFRRLYNRDSSFAAAVSLPYRLYEAGVLPKAWSIQYRDAWWKDEVRKELAAEFDRRLFSTRTVKKDGKPDQKPITENDRKPAQELMERLARYEHMRWCCFQLSRGWLPVEPVRVFQYMNAGVTKHVLQIARLHPCICSWEGLEELSRELHRDCIRRVSLDDYYSSYEEILPLLDKRFLRYYSQEEDFSFFQKIDYSGIEHTADVLSPAVSTRTETRP